MIMERRNTPRTKMEKLISGKLYHIVNFQVNNISLEGIHFLSNFEPSVGERYTIFIQFADVAKKFTVVVNRTEMNRFLEQSEGIFEAGPLFSSAGYFENLDDEASAFIQSLIKGNRDEINAGFLDEI